MPDPDAEPLHIDLASLTTAERDGLLLLIETERMAVALEGNTLVIGGADVGKAREILAIVVEAPTATEHEEIDPLMAHAPIPLPPGSHAFDRGIVLQPRHKSAIAAAAALVAAALGAVAWLAARDRRSR